MANRKPKPDSVATTEKHVKLIQPLNPSGNVVGNYVMGVINSVKLGTYLLDTGASHTIIDTQAWARLQPEWHQPEGDDAASIEIMIAGGHTVKGYPVIIPSMRIGDAVLNDVFAYVADIFTQNDFLAGVIGLNFLNRFESFKIEGDQLILELRAE